MTIRYLIRVVLIEQMTDREHITVPVTSRAHRERPEAFRRDMDGTACNKCP